MTSDLEQIAEEMESRCNKNPPIHKVGCACSWAAVLRAWIAANKESPQRKAFVEAARALGDAVEDEAKHGGYSASIATEANVTVFKRAYRAMVEAERGEGT